MSREMDDWKDTAIVVIQGVSSLFSSYLNALTAHRTFASTWRDFLSHFAIMLDFKVLDINAATFSALGSILSRCSETEQPGFDRATVDLAWDLWSRGIPVPEARSDDKTTDNQKCLLVWVEALLELYRLIQKDLSVERVQRMLTLLREAMQQASTGGYASDVEYVTPLQGRILEVFRMVRTDLPGVPSAMITQVADYVSLAFAREPGSKTVPQPRTYVAMSKESMSILQYLILTNAADHDIYSSRSFSTALSALAKPIMLKYQFPIITKSVQPWREATTSTLAILEATLPHLRTVDVPRSTLQDVWHIIIAIANGIISADCSNVSSSTDILGDQDFDIASFRKLRELIIPSLGTEAIPDKTRKSYAEGLFRTSIIHAPALSEAAIIYGNSSGDSFGLGALYKPRNGRTVDSQPTKRSNMSYVCLDELFSLVAAHDEATATPMILVQPPTPRLPRHQRHPSAHYTENPSSSPDSATQQKPHETAHALYVRLARTAAPYLILRCALPLRAYAADQPLRGRMPQPLSQRRELACVVRRLVDLRSESEAIPDTANVDCEGRKHLLRLYPLLVAAVRVAGRAAGSGGGDEKILGLLGEALETVGEELGI